MAFKRDGKFKRDSGFSRGPRKEGGFVRRDAPGFTRKPARQGGLELFDVTCAKCGKETQVPFKPSQGKPVLCRDCFKGGPVRDEKGPKRGGDDLEAIHEKLDKIMRALDID